LLSPKKQGRTKGWGGGSRRTQKITGKLLGFEIRFTPKQREYAIERGGTSKRVATEPPAPKDKNRSSTLKNQRKKGNNGRKVKRRRDG